MEFETAVTDKNRYQREAERTTLTIDLAHRLVNGLSSEAQRWHRSVERLRIQFGNLPGDMLFVSSFVAYVGGFLRPYRVDLVENSWKPALNDIKVEYTYILITYFNIIRCIVKARNTAHQKFQPV